MRMLLGQLLVVSGFVMMVVPQAWALEGQEIHFNVSVNGYPPYTIVEEDDTSGLMWQVLATYVREHGGELIPHELPPRRVEPFLLAGEIDVSMRAIEWTDDPGRFLFTDPLVTTRDVIVSVRDRALNYEGPESLVDKRVLAQLGFFYPVFDELVANNQAERVDVRSEQEVLRRLRDGSHFDAGIMDYHVARWVMANNGWEGHFHISEKPVSSAEYRLMFRPERKEVVEQFNEWLRAFRASGDLRAIEEQYR